MYLGVADLPLCCELYLGLQVSGFDFRVRHRKDGQDAAPGYIQTLRSSTDWCYAVQIHWVQHHCEREGEQSEKEVREEQ